MVKNSSHLYGTLQRMVNINNSTINILDDVNDSFENEKFTWKKRRIC